MTLNEFQLKQIEKATADFMAGHRPPPHIRPELDLEVEVKGQSVVLFEIRPAFNDRSKIIRSSVAKTTYVKTANTWKLYWQRQDLKWHSYSPKPTVKSIEEFFAAVAEDENGCFFG